MGTMNDNFVKGYTFGGVTGEKTGANLEDLVTRLYPVASSQLVDQVTLETYSDAAVTDDAGAAINRFRVKAGGLTGAALADGTVTAEELAATAAFGPKITLVTGAFTSSQISGITDWSNMLDGNNATFTAEGTITPSKFGSVYADLGAAYIGYMRLLLDVKTSHMANVYVRSGYDSPVCFTLAYGGNALQGDTPNTAYRKMGFLVPIIGRYPGIQVVTGGDDYAYVKLARFDVYGRAV